MGIVSGVVLVSFFVAQLSTGEGKLVVGQNETGVERHSKNLFPFVWVTFQPVPCGTGTVLDGVCLQRGRCSKSGGATSGSCQNGFGECCMFTAMCNATRTRVDVPELVTTLNSPAVTDTQCTFRFKKEDNICQVRLDFESYTSDPAIPEGDCETDRLKIRNSLTVDENFVACGNLNGQHMYLTFDNGQDYIELSPMLKSAASKYKIIATRIPCNSPDRAPDYCLQYFTKPSDTVKSFDYGRQQQNNQMYTVCVKPLSTSQSIMWKPCTSGVPAGGSAFSIVSNPTPTCDTDWIQLKGGPRQCASFTTLTSNWKPYELLVNFDAQEFPPVFFFPKESIDPLNCQVIPGNCMTDLPDIYDGCDCIDHPTLPPPNQACQCVLNVPGLVSPPDIDNTGFCLEYTQL